MDMMVWDYYEQAIAGIRILKITRTLFETTSKKEEEEDFLNCTMHGY